MRYKDGAEFTCSCGHTLEDHVPYTKQIHAKWIHADWKCDLCDCVRDSEEWGRAEKAKKAHAVAG